MYTYNENVRFVSCNQVPTLSSSAVRSRSTDNDGGCVDGLFLRFFRVRAGVN